MSSRATTSFAATARTAVRGAWKLLRLTLPRLYALAIMFVIIWLTYLAVAYLVTSLTAPGAVPAQITALPTRLDREVIGEGRTAFQALDAAEHPRSPLAHYHRLDSWIQPDRFNDCTRSGCHNALPHSKHKEVRAFLNMHATSLHCGVCHMVSDDVPRPLVWYNRTTGRRSDPPALLRAYARLTEPDAPKRFKSEGAPGQRRFVSLLRDAAREAANLPALRQLADHFAAYRVGSAGFEQMLTEGPDALSRHFRGEYGAKLALRDAAGRPLLGHPGTDQAVRTWQERKTTTDAAERDRLLAAVHPLRRDAALTCTDCHRTEGSLIAFEELGYPEARVRALVDPVIFRMIEHINSGRPFSLPAVVGGAPLPPPPPPGD